VYRQSAKVPPTALAAEDRIQFTIGKVSTEGGAKR
jgi:hypothetical protein